MAGARIHILVLRDCISFVPVGIADLLRKARDLAATLPGRRSAGIAEITLVSSTADRVVQTAGGLELRCGALMREVRQSDLVIVPALDPDIVAHLELNGEVVPWLQRMFAAGSDVASACTGAFVLGEAGLLDRKSATTHWAFGPLLQARYPRVRLEPEAIVVDQGRVITAGGATSFLSLALYLVERLLGADAARAASKMFLMDVNKSPQSAYAVFGPQKSHGDEDILRAQDIIEAELAEVPSVEQLAQRVAMSRRNFVRRFKLATGNAPKDYLQRVRVEAAKRALESGSRTVAEIAGAVGYEDLVAFRRLFVRWTGLTPAEYRARYGPRSAPGLVVGRRSARA